MNTIPEALHQIVTLFAECDNAEKLDLLLEYAEQLPPLPERFRGHADTGLQVHECQTPVVVFAERTGEQMQYYFDIPPESPTVRGFASLLGAGVNDSSPEAVLRIPNEFFEGMGLQKALSPRRLQGVSTILGYMKRLAVRELGGEK